MREWLSRLPRRRYQWSALALTPLLILELFVFRQILIPDDILRHSTENGVLRYAPRTTATMRHDDGRTTQVTINDHGWNSSKQRYRYSPPPGRTRIAVVGGNHVHAAALNPDQAFPEILERELNNRSIQAVDVLRFGIDDAPLSQYLHMLRHEVLPYRPDVVLVHFTHADFNRNNHTDAPRHAASFMTVRRKIDDSVREISPIPYRTDLVDAARRSSTFRYLYDKTRVAKKSSRIGTSYQAAQIVSPKSQQDRDALDETTLLTVYVMEQMQELAEEHGFQLVFTMDGVREAIYTGRDRDNYPITRLNRITFNTAANLDVPFLDLQDTFAKAFAKTGQRLEFQESGHWNRRASDSAGKAIAKFFVANPDLLQKRNVRVRKRRLNKNAHIKLFDHITPATL